MRSIQFALRSAALCSLLAGALAGAATIQGTVTDKTTNTPAAGDKVELVDVQAGMSVAANATTDSKGHYKLNAPGNGPYLVRVTHQGGQYFIAAPEGTAPGDIPVFDVAAHVDGITIEADVMEMETVNGALNVNERYFVHNTATPQRTQYNPAKGFEVVLPEGAVVDGSSAKRPTGLPTSLSLKPGSGKNHFQFDFPIQPDEGQNDTIFQLTYHLPYNGKAIFHPQVTLPADNVAVLLPMSIKFEGSGFNPIKQDPGIQTFLAKNVTPGGGLEFAINGEGSMPREQQGGAGGQGAQMAAQPSGGQPGGGIGEPINTPDPLTKYKWWILGAVGLLMAATAGFLLRKPAGATAAAPAVPNPLHPTGRSFHTAAPLATGTVSAPNVAGNHQASLLGALKEELFALESEKLRGNITADEYAEQKTALETVLKRALKQKS